MTSPRNVSSSARSAWHADVDNNSRGQFSAHKPRLDVPDVTGLTDALHMHACNGAGPMLDCVVWHDGGCWRAALDTSELHEPDSKLGALADFTPLTNYRAERQHGVFSSREGLCPNVASYLNDDLFLLKPPPFDLCGHVMLCSFWYELQETFSCTGWYLAAQGGERVPLMLCCLPAQRTRATLH